MKLIINPNQIPFTIGDTVWVNQACGESDQYAYFQAIILQIILDGSLINSIVIRQRAESHELIISRGIYDLKPVGVCARMGRQTATVKFIDDQNTLFATEEALLDYRLA